MYHPPPDPGDCAFQKRWGVLCANLGAQCCPSAKLGVLMR